MKKPTPRVYGAWAGDPIGSPEDPTRCIKSVAHGTRAPQFRQCDRKRGHGPDGLWCRQHDPDRLRAANQDAAAQRAAWTEKQDAIYRAAKRIGRRLGVQAAAVYVSNRRFDDCGYVEAVQFTFKDAEKLIARLDAAERSQTE